MGGCGKGFSGQKEEGMRIVLLARAKRKLPQAEEIWDGRF
jgi:hypothetical protein